MSETAQKLDLVWGAEAIAEIIGLDRRQTNHLLSKSLIPARKVGDKWVASRARLAAFFAEEAA